MDLNDERLNYDSSGQEHPTIRKVAGIILVLAVALLLGYIVGAGAATIFK